MMAASMRRVSGLPRITGGAVGTGYDAAAVRARDTQSKERNRRSRVMLFDTVLAFDHASPQDLIIRTPVSTATRLRSLYQLPARGSNSSSVSGTALSKSVLAPVPASTSPRISRAMIQRW